MHGLLTQPSNRLVGNMPRQHDFYMLRAHSVLTPTKAFLQYHCANNVKRSTHYDPPPKPTVPSYLSNSKRPARPRLLLLIVSNKLSSFSKDISISRVSTSTKTQVPWVTRSTPQAQPHPLRWTLRHAQPTPMQITITYKSVLILEHIPNRTSPPLTAQLAFNPYYPSMKSPIQML